MTAIPVTIIDPYSNVSLILSIVGCITGVLAFAITLIQLYRQFTHIKITFDENNNFYFNKLPQYGRFSTNKQAISSFCVTNNSDKPLTLNSIYFRVGNTMIHPEPFDGTSLQFILDDRILGELHVEILMKEYEILFPLRLEPFDSVNGVVFIPFFLNSEDPKLTIEYHLKTSRRDVKGLCLFENKKTAYDKKEKKKYRAHTKFKMFIDEKD